jgi:hypothetical protein
MRSLIVQTVKSSLISDRAQQGWKTAKKLMEPRANGCLSKQGACLNKVIV